MARRLHKTLVDYLVIAISPALIITLIGSLVFFLLEVFYRGQHDVRLHAIFGLFVMATVLIGRIAIEEGKERAHLFAAPLAIVTFLALQKYVHVSAAGPGTLWNVLLIALIWWCAHKVTWDCTLIDEAERDSGEGLLESAGLDRPAVTTAQRDAPQQEETEPEGTTSRDSAASSWWQRVLQRQRRPHAPGVWVVYFSLAALPLFGIGQALVPPAGRQHAFNLLFIYVASGLGLLLSTSFLGLRRYLRQRRVEMPAAMAGLWLAMGGVLIIALLVFVDFLPRPSAEYSAAQLPFTILSPFRKPSRVAVGQDGVQDEKNDALTGAPGKERQSDTPPREDDNGTQSGGSEDSGDGSGKEDSQDGKRLAQDDSQDATAGQGTTQRPGDSAEESATSQKPTSQEPSSQEPSSQEPTSQESTSSKPDEGRTGNVEQPRSSPGPSGLGSGLGWLKTLAKWVLYAALIVVAAWWLWRSRAEVLAALRDFLQGWRDFWQRLFGRKRKLAEAADVMEKRSQQPSPRPFAAFADPFATGTADRLAPDELVRYSFEALEAWARERDCPRDPDQTPHEFARRVGDRAETVARHAQRLADLYCRVAYAPGTLPAGSTDPLRQLWSSLRQAETAAFGPR